MSTRNHVREICERQVRAVQDFVGTIMEIAECTEEEAYKAFDTLKKAKAFQKYDSYNGKYNVKHGAFLEREVLIRAMNYDHGSKKKIA